MYTPRLPDVIVDIVVLSGSRLAILTRNASDRSLHGSALFLLQPTEFRVVDLNRG